MLQRDYLMRQIHQMTQVLARVLFHKSNDRPALAIDEINQALQNMPGFDALMTSGLSREDVLEICGTEKGLQSDVAFNLADLLREKAQLVPDAGGRATFAQYALWLYQAGAEQEGAVVPLDLEERISEVKRLATGDN